MDAPEPAQIVAGSIALVAIVTMAVTQLPKWWGGSSSVSPDRAPENWVWSATTWSRLARGLPVGLLVLGLAAAALLTALVSPLIAGWLLAVTVAATTLWLSIITFARPRSLIPPPWRPDH